ncbi:serine hydrolase [Janthinobacterium sp. BJB412]|nr:serine hydrolase [Janthinobacterium sp. BJB412]
MHFLSEHFRTVQSKVPASDPGFSALVVRHGEPLFELHHGVACMELGVPLSGRSRYYMGSESKQFTAACILDLVRQGRLSLDEDVRARLPIMHRIDTPVALRNLLNHSSGIPDYLPYLDLQLGRHESNYFDNPLALQLIEKFDELDFAPGSRYDYSNSNYQLLAQLIEVVSGTPLAAYARRLVFEPLAMAATDFDVDRQAVLPDRVRSYSPDPLRPRGYKQHLGNANTVGDGGLYSCTDDLLRLERDWHRRHAEPDSLVRALLQESHDNDGALFSYRYGLECLSHEGMDYVFHSGCLWGFNTLILRVPNAGLSVIQLSNNDLLEPDQPALLRAIAADLAAEAEAKAGVEA